MPAMNKPLLPAMDAAGRLRDLRGSFCIPTVLLCGEAHGAVWADAQIGRGRLLDLAEGARQVGAEWAVCAEATRKLA
jgi:hypothetical protein